VLPHTGARASLASLPLHPHGCTYAYTRTGHVATAAWMAPHSSAVASRWRSSGVSDAAREPEGGRARRLATTHSHAPHRCAPYQHSPPQETSLFVAPCVCVAMGLALGKVALLVADVAASRCFCVQVGITEGGLRELKKIAISHSSLTRTHAPPPQLLHIREWCGRHHNRRRSSSGSGAWARWADRSHGASEGALWTRAWVVEPKDGTVHCRVSELNLVDPLSDH
jgi:hypothetical protein